MKKVEKKTRILTDCLAQTKVSNVVKQNAKLTEDHNWACRRLIKFINAMSTEALSPDIRATPLAQKF